MKIINSNYEILTPIDGSKILKHIELCGRVCYKSEDKISEDSAERFVHMLINSGHTSVLEHFSFSVRFINDRGISHETVRHRLASFSQESTRYCSYSKEKYGNEITYIDITQGIRLDSKTKNLSPQKIALIIEEWGKACRDAEKHYFKMIELGATPQIARSVLNHSTKTEIVITANLRQWREILRQRTMLSAHPQIREVMFPFLNEIRNLIPIIFDDIEVR